MIFKPSVDASSQSSLPGELDLIRRIRARARRSQPGSRRVSAGLRLGIGDDCALLRVRAGEELAVTTDLSIAGRHFRLDWHPPEVVGHRTLARGLSDLAAMGARPVAAFLSLGVPAELARKSKARAGKTSSSWLDRYLEGFFGLADSTGTQLAGGDLAQSPIFAADIVLIGAVKQGHALLRSGARPGHFIYVTGSIGGSAAGLKRLAESARNFRRGTPHLPSRLDSVLAAHLIPQPRLAVGQELSRKPRASAAIDISDGLSTDLAHICEESHVAAEIDALALPISPEATLVQALHGGEDYELLFTAPQTTRIPRMISGVPVTRIGRILSRKRGQSPITLLTAKGPQALQPRGWEHFTAKSEAGRMA